MVESYDVLNYTVLAICATTVIGGYIWMGKIWYNELTSKKDSNLEKKLKNDKDKDQT